MCRLFVWNDPLSAVVNRGTRFQVGHVIDVLEDGAFGGNEVEGKNATGQFQVVEMPGVPAAKYEYLKSGDPPPSTEVTPTVYPRLRINILDLTTLKVAAPPDAQTKIITAPSEQTVTALISVMQPVPVGTVIGDNPLVIG